MGSVRLPPLFLLLGRLGVYTQFSANSLPIKYWRFINIVSSVWRRNQLCYNITLYNRGDKMLAKGHVKIGINTRFGPNWPGIRCLAKTRRGTKCQRAAYKRNGRCGLHGGLSTGARSPEGLQRISEANIKHGRQTKEKLAAQRHAAKVGRRVMAELRLIECQLVDAGLLPDNC